MKAFLAAWCATVAALGCNGGTGPESSGLKVTLTLATNDLVPAQRTTISVAATLGGQATSATGATFRSGDPSIASVSADGEVTAVTVGQVTISATLRGVSGSVLVRVRDGGIIGPAGGTLGVPGQIELVIPAGAVSESTLIRLDQGTPPGVDPTAVTGATYLIGSDNLVFAQPATLRLRYQLRLAPIGLPQSALGARRMVASAWSDIRPSTLDSISGNVTITVTRGGTYGVGRLVPTAPCADPEYRAFDFWLGDWNVVTQTGQLNGQNLITMEPGGCAIFEFYTTPTAISPGRSISFYEPVTRKWYQTYVDAGANRLDISSVSFGASGIVTLSPAAGNVYQRHAWYPQPGGTVRQIGEVTTNNGQTFTTLYDLIYRRK